MEFSEEEKDLTFNRAVANKNTFQRMFPVYAPELSKFTSTSKTAHSQSVDYSDLSDFSIHNQDLHRKTYNKKVDRMVHYTEAMLKVKNMRALKK